VASDAALAEVQPIASDRIEVLLTLVPAQYAQMGDDLERLRARLDLPRSASTTEIIVEAVHRQAASG
jgi:hypothetical protein